MMLGVYDKPPSVGGVLLFDASSIVETCQVTTNSHGFERLTATTRTSLTDAFRLYDMSSLPHVGLWEDSQLVWEGRLEDPVLSGGGFQIQALGYWCALSDDRYTALWSKTSLDGWRMLTNVDSSDFFENRFQMSTENDALMLMPVKGSTQGAGIIGATGYELPNAGTRPVIGAQFTIEIGMPSGNWRTLFASGPSALSRPTRWSLTPSAPYTKLALHLTFPNTTDQLVLFMFYNNTSGAYSGETGSHYIRVSNLRLVTSTANRINTTFTAGVLAGASTATVVSTAGMYVGQQLVIDSGNTGSEIVTVTSVVNTVQFTAVFASNHSSGEPVQGFKITSDEIVRDVVQQVATLNPTQLSASSGLVQSSGLDLLDEEYQDAVPSDVIRNLAELGDSQAKAWETGVYESRQLYFRPRIGDFSRRWFVDASDVNVSRTVTDLTNRAYATYRNASGAIMRTNDATNIISTTQYGIIRRGVNPANTTSTTQAVQQRNTLLNDQAQPPARATISFNNVFDLGGAIYPLWLVRSGDVITIRNLSPSISSSVDSIRTFRIVHTNYDASARRLEVEPDSPPSTLEVLLARRAEGIA